MKISQPTTLRARMNANIPARRVHSRADRESRMVRRRAVAAWIWPDWLRMGCEPSFRRGLVGQARQARRPDSSPRRGFTVAGQCRAHTGLRWNGGHPGKSPGLYRQYALPTRTVRKIKFFLSNGRVMPLTRDLSAKTGGPCRWPGRSRKELPNYYLISTAILDDRMSVAAGRVDSMNRREHDECCDNRRGVARLRERVHGRRTGPDA